MIRLILGVLLGFATTNALCAAVEGVYRANGNDVPARFALLRKGDDSNPPTVKLILSQKDASADTRADFSAQMGDLGSAVVITLARTDAGYDVIGALFAHPALKRSGANASHLVQARDIVVADGEMRGRIVSGADAMLFDETIEIDLTFRARTP